MVSGVYGSVSALCVNSLESFFFLDSAYKQYMVICLSLSDLTTLSMVISRSRPVF